MCDTYTGITWYHTCLRTCSAVPYAVWCPFQSVGAPISDHLTYRFSRDWAGHMSVHRQYFETRGYTAGVGRKDH
ncbi:hypothetical protein SCLCIDRAFT_1225301 [Scleroderma citrinum Foug A]|uniref:Uncharacterized protein n=1 Tax=Scleroderma citrinum Foug A TaxID=1036808 RepID=A0A0C3D325_9AGAM|nr:hypothetical protein SCLCIDRAFT_1225301 [Scleroderma citrinum Foug A]